MSNKKPTVASEAAEQQPVQSEIGEVAATNEQCSKEGPMKEMKVPKKANTENGKNELKAIANNKKKRKLASVEEVPKKETTENGGQESHPAAKTRKKRKFPPKEEIAKTREEKRTALREEKRKALKEKKATKKSASSK